MVQPPPSLIAFVSARVRDSMQVEARGDFHRLKCRAMSTPVNIAFTASPAVAKEFGREAIEWIAHFEARYSRFLPESIVGQINAASGGDWFELDEDADRLLLLCADMHCLTRGVFDPATLPLLRIWDWKAQPPRIPPDSAILAAHEISGWDKVQRRPRGNPPANRRDGNRPRRDRKRICRRSRHTHGAPVWNRRCDGRHRAGHPRRRPSARQKMRGTSAWKNPTSPANAGQRCG